MIYLDNAATTRPDPAALARATELYGQTYFNPSARYGGGFAAHSLMEHARQALLCSAADPALFDLVFTSCGTEADNTAVRMAKRGNAVTTAGEHAAVYESFVQLRARGVEPRFAPLREDGSVSPEALLAMVDDATSLVSVVHVNNETGAVNDVAALARAVKKKNPRCIFHSDGVQAFGKLAFRLPAEIDLYSVSAHKIGGLKGTGALFRRKTCSLQPMIYGGGQENGLRSGTENVLGILDFAFAAENTFSRRAEHEARLALLREKMWGVLAGGGFVRISPQGGSPYILTVSCRAARGEVLQRMLYDRGVAVGTGSACSSKKPVSRVLEAIGTYDRAALGGVLRVSFSGETTEEDALRAADLICEAANEYMGKV